MSYPQEDKKQQLYGDEKQQHDAPPPFSTQQQHRVGRGAPSPGPPRQGDTGTFPGGTYNITHRDNDAVLNVNLQQDGAFIRAKPGAMIYMSGSVQLSGKTNFSMRDMFSGKETAESTYLGPGRISLCPTLSGDVFPLYIDNQASWTIAKNVYLACTSGITRAAVRKSFKNVRAGDMILVYTVGGQGIIWLTSFGAIDRLDVSSTFEDLHNHIHCAHMSLDSTWRAIRCR